MKITYLLLRNFKRFPLRDVEVFEHEFNSKLTMIIGANGSGKSTLISELSPLPTSKDSFSKDGYKEIHISKDNNVYRLICDYTKPSGDFYFFCNDENLNQSLNISTQRELAEKHFGITQTVHDILVGVEHFTDMSLLARKKLFSAITHLDIDTLIANYNSLKEELKNNEYMLKTQRLLLTTEQDKLKSTDEVTRLEEERSSLNRHVEYLLNIRERLAKYTTDQEVDNLICELNNLRDKYKAILTKYNTYLTSYPVVDYESNLKKFTQALARVESNLSDTYTRYDKLEKDIKILKMNNLSSIESLESELKTRETELLQIKSKLTMFNDYESDINQLNSDVYLLINSLKDVLLSIPKNEDKRFSKDRLEHLLTHKSKLLETYTELTNTEITTKETIASLQTHNHSTTCPKCAHSWIDSEVSCTLTSAKITLETTLTSKAKCALELETVNTEIDAIHSYIELYRQFANIRKTTYQSLRVFWDDAVGTELIFTDPQAIVSQIGNLSSQVSTLSQYQQVKRDIDTIRNNISYISSLETTNEKVILAEIDSLSYDIEKLLVEKAEITCRLKDIELSKRVYKACSDIEMSVNMTLNSLKNTSVSEAVKSVMDVIATELSMVRIRLVSIDTELSGIRSVKHTLDKYQSQISDLECKVNVLSALTTELSPKNGILAKSISSFLNIIIANVNNVLSSIWSYKMQLRVIDIENDSLNYKFKVEVDDKLVIEDIAKVSSGMKEIINLSFKLIIMKLLNLEGYPVYLDELGSRLDKHHRGKITDLVFRLLGSSQYSQVFLVTHLDMSYSLIKDVDVIELS